MGFYYRFKKLLFNNISFFMIIFNVVKSKECSFLPFDCVLCQECVFLLRYHRAYAHLCLDFCLFVLTVSNENQFLIN